MIITMLSCICFIGLYIFHNKLLTYANSESSILSPIQIERLENSLFKLKTKEDINIFLEKNSLVAEQLFVLNTSQDKNKVIDMLYNMVRDRDMQSLYQELQSQFTDLASINKELEEMFHNLKQYYPNFQLPKIVTFITGMGIDLVVTKDLIVIGLDFFLGKDSSFRPTHLPNYILRTYEPSYIVPKIALLLSHQFNNMHTTESTLLYDMLYHGKTYFFTKMLLPKMKDFKIIGYTKKQLEELNQHQDIVWKHFIDHELFYITNHMVKKKYLGDRPFTSEIGPGCPGNVGGWLGWEIIKQYMKKNPTISLPILMENTDAQGIFTRAKYRPKR